LRARACAFRLLIVASLLVSAVGALTCVDRPFICQRSDECVHGGVQGVCESDRRCSFPDGTCPSTRRYGDYGTERQCVTDVCGQAGGPCCQGNSCQAGLACRDDHCVCAVAIAAAGASHTCLAFADGRAACFGNNARGQLGDDTLANRTAIGEVPGLTSVVGLASLADHTCAIVRSGMLWCWGDNSRGQLGDGTMENRARPQQVGRLDRVIGVAVGSDHTCALRDDGSVSCWGDNSYGQLGDGTQLLRLIPQAVRGIPGTVDQIDAGEDFTCARLHDGRIACWGSNTRQEIEMSEVPQYLAPHVLPDIQDAVALAVGGSHACARRMGGAVVCWGATAAGQTGKGSMAPMVGPDQVPSTRPLDGIAAGDTHTCALSGSDGVVCWGGNASGQSALALPDAVALPTYTPLPGVTSVEAGGRHSCALFADGGMSCWGERSDGQLGDDYAVVTVQPTKVALQDAVEVAAGSAFACARLREQGAVTCWGNGSFLRLGDQTGRSRPSPQQPVAGLSMVAQLALGGEFACARTIDGAVRCWGRGDSGQLGDGMRSNEGGVTLVALPAQAGHISAGMAHACAALVTGQVYCWGRNTHGEVGAAPGSADSSRPIAVPQLSGVVEVACGDAHSCGRTAAGLVECWGAADAGQLGLSGPPSESSNPVLVDEIRAAVELTAGGRHNCARLMDGTIECWGAGNSGQLGSGVLLERNPRPMEVPDLPQPVERVSAGGLFTCAVAGGHAYCWGLNRDGEVGDGTQLIQKTPVPVTGLPEGGIVALGPGDSHGCAVTAGGDVYCWGRNRNGETGSGMALFRAMPQPVRLGCR
jgi:alpha-tubulin suppressor-like RCC1 family protein